MADDVSIKISAETSQLRTELAAAESRLRGLTSEVRSTADAMRDAGGDPALEEKLKRIVVECTEAQERVASFKAELRGGEEEEGFLAVFDGLKGRLSALTNLGGEFKEIGEAFIAAFAVEKIADWVKETAEAGEQAQHLSQELGMTTEQVTEFGGVAQVMGLSVEEGARSIEHLERSMAAARNSTSLQARAFAALGVSATDSQGNLRPVNDVMGDIAEAMSHAKDGADKTAISMDLLGRSGAQMISYFNRGKEGIAELNAEIDKTGTVLSGPVSEGMEQTKDQMTLLDLSVKGVSISLFEKFKPAIDSVVGGLKDFVQSCNDAINSDTALGNTISGIADFVGGFIVIIKAITTGIVEFADTAIYAFAQVSQAGTMLGGVLHDLFTGNFQKLQTDWSANWNQMRLTHLQFTKDVEAQEKAFGDTMQNIYGDKPDEKKPKRDRDLKAPPTNGGKQQDHVQQWKDELQQQLEATNNYFADSKKAELAFWEDKKATAGANVKELQQINSQIYALNKSLAQEDLANYTASIREKEAREKDNIAALMADEDALLATLKADYGENSKQYEDELKHKEDLQRQSNERLAAQALEWAKTEADIRKQGLAAQIDNLQAGSNSGPDQIAQIRDLTEQEFEIDQDYARKKMALSGQTKDEQLKDYEDLANLQAANATKMASLDKQMADAQLAPYKTVFDGIKSGFDTMFNGILQGTQTFTQLSAKLLQNLAATALKLGLTEVENFALQKTRELIVHDATETQKTAATVSGNAARDAADASGSAGFLSRIGTQLADWLGLETSKTAATTAGTAARTAVQTSAAVAGKAADAAIGSATVIGDANKAAAGAYAATVDIPVVGPILAPAAAATAFAAVSAFDIFSASGGFDIPGGVNPVTQLHQREMVLPAPIADVIRNRVGDASGSTATTNNFKNTMHFHGVKDADTFRRSARQMENVTRRSLSRGAGR